MWSSKPAAVLMFTILLMNHRLCGGFGIQGKSVVRRQEMDEWEGGDGSVEWVVSRLPGQWGPSEICRTAWRAGAGQSAAHCSQDAFHSLKTSVISPSEPHHTGNTTKHRNYDKIRVKYLAKLLGLTHSSAVKQLRKINYSLYHMWGDITRLANFIYFLILVHIFSVLIHQLGRNIY